MKKAKITKNKPKIVWHISFKHGLEAGFVRGQEVGAAKRDDILRGYQSGKSRGSAFVLAKKQAAAGRSFTDGYQTGKRHGRVLTLKGKAATKKGAKLVVATTALPFIWGQAAASSVRAQTTTKAHRHLERKAQWYANYHQHKHHRKFHYAAVGSHLLIYSLIAIMALISTSQPARAYSTWNQTDWSGGLGGSTTNQYASKTNIDASATKLEVSPNHVLNNESFESDLAGWNMTGGDTGTFELTGTYTTSSYSNRDLTSADLDGDGDKDMMVTSENAGVVSVFKNNGDGTFDTRIDYATGLRPLDVSSADLDGDGDIDMAVMNLGGNSVSILKNNGNGTFATKVDYANNSGAAQVIIKDLDSDNDQDIVTVNQSTSNVSIFKNNGDGTFAAKVNYTAGNGSSDIVSADIDGDSDNDLATSNYTGGSISILKNNGDGTFAAKADFAIGGAYNLAGQDLDHDGDFDLVSTPYSSYGPIKIFKNDGSGNFTLGSQYGYSYPSQVHFADFDGDGHVDFAVSVVNNTDKLSIYKNQGDGSFSWLADYTPGGYTYFIDVNDYDNDGNADIATTQYTSNTLKVLRNKGFLHKASTDQAYSGSKSAKLVTGAANGDFQQLVTPTAGAHKLVAYVYNAGNPVTSSEAQLYSEGGLVSTTYEATGQAGWYKLSSAVTTSGSQARYGLRVFANKTLYVDDAALLKYGSGSLTSAILDTTTGEAWGNLNYNSSGSTVAVKVRSSNASDMSGAPGFSTCTAIASGTDLTGTSCVNDNDRYVQYQVVLTGTGSDTPVVNGVSIDYSPYDTIPPITNASSITMEKIAGGDSVSAGQWTNGSAPYFEWQAAADNPGGTGVKGYCVYLGQSSSADPVTTKGMLGTSPINSNGACPFVTADLHLDLSVASNLASPLTSSSNSYYLNIKALDNVGNVFSGSSAAFDFKFDNTPPSNPAYISGPSGFISTKTTTFTWPSSGGDSASDANSGVVGMQYRIGAGGQWRGDGPNGSGNLTNDGSYTTRSDPDFPDIVEGNNVFYFRTIDNAGNISPAYVTSTLKLNTNAPSSPQNVTATPSTNTNNNFAFSWDTPASYVGNASDLTYCYSINTLPSVSTCTYTSAGVTSLSAGAYATQPGDNTFYVVAKDNNINYATASSVTFTANTSAPGMPLNIDIADTSVKATANWRLAVSWETPTNIGAGVASYRIFRSTDNNNFTQVASTAGTSYVDSGLSAQEYYYKVKACDSANNCGADSAVVHELPTGKFTTPADLISNPKVESLSTRKTTIGWVTDRNSDSRIAYGTKSGNYFATEAASSDQVTAHKVELNGLTAGTTYYYKAKWIDGDGNVGQSAEYSFTTAPSPSCREVSATKIGLSEATLQLTCRDSTKIKVLYGKSEQFGGQAVVNTSTADSTYNVPLIGLDDGVKYSYKLNTFDSDGNEYEGAVTFNFTTPARPRISNLKFQPVDGEPTSTQKVTWTTNVAATSGLSYGKNGSSGSELQDSKLVIDHEMVIRDLEDNSEYFLVATSRDGSGNLATSDRQVFHTALDTRPPKITKVMIEPSVKGSGVDARGQLIVSWHTDEPATSQVSFDDGKGGTTSRTNEDAALVTDHVVVVSDLSPAQVYSVIATSRDKAGNSVQSTTQSAIVGRASDSIFAIIFNALQQIFGLSSK